MVPGCVVSGRVRWRIRDPCRRSGAHGLDEDMQARAKRGQRATTGLVLSAKRAKETWSRGRAMDWRAAGECIHTTYMVLWLAAMHARLMRLISACVEGSIMVQ